MRLDLPRKPSAYSWHIELQTRFADMDIRAHLNNVSIARLFEETRVRFNHHLKDLIPGFQPFQFVMASLHIDFLAEGHYPAPVLMGQGVTHVGTTSFGSGMAMFQGDRCLALCQSVLVHKTESGTTALPEAFRAQLAGLVLNTGDNM
jgi:acyl-CoA thioester hydrolase